MSIEKNDPELDEALAALPKLDVSEFSRVRIKKNALAVFAEEGESGWMRKFDRIYTYSLEPALIFGVAPLYLLWAISNLVGIFSHST
jgi:hypothetical protein